MINLKLLNEQDIEISYGSEIKLVSDKIYRFMELSEFTPETVTEYCDWSAQNYLPAVIKAVAKDAPEGSVMRLSSEIDNRSFELNNDCAEFTNLYPGCEYKCAIYSGNSIISNTVIFRTADLMPRTVIIDGADNGRDIGGTVTPDGKRIKLGIIYRGSNLRTLTDKGLDTFLNQLKIRTELDTSGGSESNPAFEGKINTAFHSTKWYSLIFDYPDFYPALRDAIKVFANPDNYPVYIHCSLGRDRTGTVAFILKALCGCTREQLYREHLLSFFSLRGDAENAGIAAHLGNINSLYGVFMNQLGDGYSLLENVRSFMNKIGVTDEDIENIRKNMLE